MKYIKYLTPFLLILALLLPMQAAAAPVNVIPTFSIVSVDEDNTVTIKTANFPADDTFTVTMGAMGVRGVNGTIVATQDSGSGGSFTATYDIPENMKGAYQIALRLESSASGYYAFNWFYNNVADGTTPPAPIPVGTIPTFSIKSVVRDSTVTIETKNFPANDSFTVTMGPMGTRGVNGTVIETQDSGEGGTFTATYDVPAGLHGDYKIAIRLKSSASGYYAFNWFYNNTTTGSGASGSLNPSDTPTPTETSVPVVIPTFSITKVKADKNVTISAKDFPLNDTYTVTMGPMGKKGVNGYVVGTYKTESDGSFTAAFQIPDELKGSEKIAIRLQSPSSGYYSFNWFHNDTAP